MDAAPELLYVNSKITEPSKLSPELFTSWYNDIHVPDIFETSGIKQAYRYFTTAEDPTSIERPYLALYPIKFKGYLQSEEFFGIPVKSDVLPGPNAEIFDVADFDTRYYTSSSARNTFGGPFVMTVQIGDSGKSLSGSDLQSTATCQCYFARQNRRAPDESEIGTPPANLVLVWYQSQEELDKGAQQASQIGKVAKFKLIKSFTAQK